ncbi:uncharacterized protein G2W53_008121 [Senna tora]|uniref:HTH Mu-type domain-containing protein n=1 Tax=Senna tora TaxID=362788 RepID=A0A835CEX7_9FABA|nr:uncharacterized protein G2W53_008121 [Senna tora]
MAAREEVTKRLQKGRWTLGRGEE